MSNTAQQSTALLIKHASQVILGKEQAIKLAACTLLANGHLLITDQPGVGKTTLANTLARLFGLNTKRIQFTSDLLPADITGTNIFDQTNAKFTFHPGPVFAGLVLADEINRATPKCQSALLEAMEERQVTIDRKTYPLPKPFFVIATRNPSEHAGTFALPESQLNRFMLDIKLGHPDRGAERQMLTHSDPREKLTSLQPLFTEETLQAAQAEAKQITTSPALIDYLQDILAYTRTRPEFTTGYSPRAAMTLLAAAKAWAFIAGRNHVLPEDIQTILPHTNHHLTAKEPGTNLTDQILNNVAIQ